jgi:hypothetical protein
VRRLLETDRRSRSRTHESTPSVGDGSSDGDDDQMPWMRESDLPGGGDTDDSEPVRSLSDLVGEIRVPVRSPTPIQRPAVSPVGDIHEPDLGVPAPWSL